MDHLLQRYFTTISLGFPLGRIRHGSYDGGVKDPRRIPVMTDALTRLWEARPDLTLTRLLGLLETHGADWNATDEETLAVLGSFSPAAASPQPTLLAVSTPAPSPAPAAVTQAP